MRSHGRKHRMLCAVLAIAGTVPGLAAIQQEEIPPLKPAQGALTEPEPEKPVWPWVIAAVAVPVVLFLAWPKGRRQVPVEPPDVRAGRELQALTTPDANALGAILRRYFTSVYPVPGPGQTFEELARLLAQQPRWTPLLTERLHRLTDPLELARFAPSAAPADMARLREEAQSFIRDLESLRQPPPASSQP